MQTPNRFVSHPDTADASAIALERLRTDLEMIAYIASHDLQSPLRIILSCMEMLAHQEQQRAPEEAETLQVMQTEALRMKALVQGLLDYVRLETFTPSSTTVDLNEVASAACTALEKEISDANATVTTSMLPQVRGHRGRLTQLFMHLLDNALKFRDPARRVALSLTAEPRGAMWEFTLEDNGLGIEEEFHNLVFTLFQRLHTAEAYAGYGIGLALCRKIVESHGGHIWVESSPGKGSRFRFTLPAADQQKG